MNTQHTRVFLIAALALIATPGFAEDDRGYSFFMALGQQHVTYKEEPSILPVKTDVSVTNPLIITGALYPVTADLLVSLDAETTFAADTTTEQWKATGAQFAGTALTNSTLQENQFKLQQTGTRLLAHYRLHKKWFVLTGPAFRTQTFKRFSFEPGPDNATTVLENQVVEESSSEILWQLGAALESEQLRDSRVHYGFRFYTAVPLWREVENTLIPGRTFPEKSGQDWTLEGRYSFAVFPNVHVGAWAQYSLSKRDSQKACVPFAGSNNPICGMNQAQAELPKSELRSGAYGLEVLWKL